MVRSAEVTGRLEEVMSFMADYLEKETGLMSRVRNALIYPVVVIVLFAVVSGIMIGFVFPQLQPIFTEANVQLPLMTRILLEGRNFYSRLVGDAFGCFIGFYFCRRGLFPDAGGAHCFR